MVKKIHSTLTLLLCFLLLLHLVATGLFMSYLVPIRPWVSLLAKALIVVLIAHLLLILVPLLLKHDFHRRRPYIKLNWRCYAQRIAGVLIIALIHPHLQDFYKPGAPVAQPSLGVTPPVPYTMINLFYLAGIIGLTLFCCVHISLSIPKALVGLGLIVEEKPLARIEKICFICVFAVGAFAIWAACMMASFSGLFGGAV